MSKNEQFPHENGHLLITQKRFGDKMSKFGKFMNFEKYVTNLLRFKIGKNEKILKKT